MTSTVPPWRLRGQLALGSAMLWGVAAFRLPTWVAVVPIALAAIALWQFILLVRPRTSGSHRDIDGENRTRTDRTWVRPDVVLLLAVGGGGLAALIVRYA